MRREREEGRLIDRERQTERGRKTEAVGSIASLDSFNISSGLMFEDRHHENTHFGCIGQFR